MLSRAGHWLVPEVALVQARALAAAVTTAAEAEKRRAMAGMAKEETGEGRI